MLPRWMSQAEQHSEFSDRRSKRKVGRSPLDNVRHRVGHQPARCPIGLLVAQLHVTRPCTVIVFVDPVRVAGDTTARASSSAAIFIFSSGWDFPLDASHHGPCTSSQGLGHSLYDDAGSQRLFHRTTVGDLEQLRSLLLGKRSRELDLPVDSGDPDFRFLAILAVLFM